jgi:hypothetical protein
MIFDGILALLGLTLDGIVFLFSQLGSIPDNSAIIAGINTFGGYLSPLSNILPLGTILLILAFEVVFETAYFGYKVIRWVYQKLPFIN